MSRKMVRRTARRLARRYKISVRLAERSLWDAIDMRDEIANRYPA